MILDWNRYCDLAVKTISEGIVMLKNDNSALPLDTEKTVSVFGRIQLHYYKSGTGSGGMVNVSKIIGITEALIDRGVKVNTTVLDEYKRWDEENPFDHGLGWGKEPWSQAEMPLDEDFVKSASEVSDTALIVIGRTAGEEQDNKLLKGAYFLSDGESDMLKVVKKYFKKTVVLLNVGNIIDMGFVDEYNPDTVLYLWQGGMLGGLGAADVLIGKMSPCGKLADTIPYDVSDCSSHKYFGDEKRNFYVEDIYVGYRWFETFAKDKVRYPFGYGISYTRFDISTESFSKNGDTVLFKVKVKNTDEFSGKEVVQLYLSAPQGKLGKPSRSLLAFSKTRNLAPNESETIEFTVSVSELASYDDSGITGYKSAYVLECGEYSFYIGADVRSAEKCGEITIDETTLVSQRTQAVPPVLPFDRIRNNNGTVAFENVPVLSFDEKERIISKLPEEIPYTGDKGIKLSDVKLGKNTMNEFIAQLSDTDLSCIVRGEGMGSPKVTAGTASAFGGVSKNLSNFGIPCCCCSDGPSGMRMDCGTKAFSLPNGTLMACTFNQELVEELFAVAGLEIAANNVECLLGPGMNIHRHPLNGRNFEYMSEDPLLTGKISASELRGLHQSGVTGTIKHFSGNNQESHRHVIDSVISERALREIYLRGFEIAVKEGNARSVMTTYGGLNGLWTAAHYDLTTTILRDEWGFDGIVMTDWWADINSREEESLNRTDFAAMVRAQNDMYMVCADGETHDDNTLEALENGSLTRCELQRSAKNICNFILGTRAMDREMGCEEKIEIINKPVYEDDVSSENVDFYEFDDNLTVDLSDADTSKGKSYPFTLVVNTPGMYRLTITASSRQSELAQIPVTMFVSGTVWGVFTFNGTNGELMSFSRDIPLFSHFTSARAYFGQSGLENVNIKFEMLSKAESTSYSVS